LVPAIKPGITRGVVWKKVTSTAKVEDLNPGKLDQGSALAIQMIISRDAERSGKGSSGAATDQSKG